MPHCFDFHQITLKTSVAMACSITMPMNQSAIAKTNAACPAGMLHRAENSAPALCTSSNAVAEEGQVIGVAIPKIVTAATTKVNIGLPIVALSHVLAAASATTRSQRPQVRAQSRPATNIGR